MTNSPVLKAPKTRAAPSGRSAPARRTGSKRSATAWARRSHLAASLVAFFVAVTGLLNVLTVLVPGGDVRLDLITDLFPEVAATARAGTVAIGLLLILLAGSLRRRKRAGWLAVVILCVVNVALNLLRGPELVSAAIGVGVLAALLLTRRQFPALGDPRSRWLAVTALLTFVPTDLLVGYGYLAARGEHVIGDPSRLQRAEHVALGLIGFSGPVRFNVPGVTRTFDVLTGLLGGLTLLVTVYLLLRPGRGPDLLTADDEARLRSLLDSHGRRDSLGYFALRRDKAVIWSPTGKAAVAYRVVGGVSLASGDPIGDPEAWPGAIERWLDECRLHAWVPAVVGCSEQAGRIYGRYGLDALELGDEAIIDIAEFTLDGRPMRGVRHAVARVDRAGYRCSVHRMADLDATSRADVIRAAERYRDGNVERGFTMALSRLGDPADDASVVVTARDADGRLRGLLHLVPWGHDGLSLALMRRDPRSDNGLVEAMVVALVAHAGDFQLRRVSLNFAVFRSVFARGERLGAGPIIRASRGVLLLASRFWQLESLYRANAKYRPRWEPRFLCFAAASDLPKISVAVLRAEAFLTVPRPLAAIRERATRDPRPQLAGTRR